MHQRSTVRGQRHPTSSGPGLAHKTTHLPHPSRRNRSIHAQRSIHNVHTNQSRRNHTNSNSSIDKKTNQRPTTDERIQQLNEKLAQNQPKQVVIAEIPASIPNLNVIDTSKPHFNTHIDSHSFNPDMLAPSSLVSNIINRVKQFSNDNHSNRLKVSDILQSSTEPPSEAVNVSPLSQNANNDDYSAFDAKYRYENADDSSFFDTFVDPFAQKKKENEKRSSIHQERQNRQPDTPERLAQVAAEGEALQDQVDDSALNNDIANGVLQTQALSAYIMQKKALNHPHEARPVFWHGTIPYHDKHKLNHALGALEGGNGQDKNLPVNLDWRTFLDLSQPHLWYPTARMLKRKIILHCGPTNSGKTHRAMVRLQEAESGLYCGPLRLLAWENYERLNANDIPCSLLTGQEVMELPNAKHVSSTVEMVNFDRLVDVAVIDEIQMIQDRDRGFAWTRALLGVPAKEVHLCGDATSLEWLQRLTQITGEELHICRYERLSPLTVQNNVITGYKHLRKGDCVVAFSRREVYSIKKKIETETGRRCAIIYGNLPPDVRKQQAQLFNSGQLDILVASDAIGMGLNLNIGRVIFSTVTKFDGQQFRRLSQTETLQIGGRAGRFNTQYHNGFVSVMYNQEDLEFVRQQFQTSLPPMTQAQVLPTTEHFLAFCERFPEIKFSDYLTSLATHAKVTDEFCIGDVSTMAQLAAVIDRIKMPSYNRVMLAYAPLSIERFASHRALLQELAERLVQDEPIPIPKIAYVARPQPPSSPEEVAKLEETFTNLEAYIWLWYRLGDQLFMHRQAKLDRESCQRIILDYLMNA